MGLFLKDNVKNYFSFDSLVKEIRQQGGLVLFPHPFKGHTNIEYIAQHVDLIEVFNSRTSDECNKLGNKIASKYNVSKSYGSDAHNRFELGNAIVEIEVRDSLKSALQNDKIKVDHKKKTRFCFILFSQFVKSFKKKDIKLFISQIWRMLVYIYEGKLFSKV